MLGVVGLRLARDLEPVIAESPSRSIVRWIGSGRIQLCMDTFIDIALLLKPQLPGVHDAERVECALDISQRVERGTVLRGHVRRELEPDAVVVVHDAARLQDRGHAVVPDPVVQLQVALGHQEARVDHRAPAVPVRVVDPQLSPSAA